jgi:anti-sigma factor RsiW
MMRCERVEELSSDYVDGRLAARPAGEVEAHLRTCSDCRSLVGDIQQIKALLARTAPPTAEPEFWNRALARARAAAPAARQRLNLQALLQWQRGAAWATATASLAVGVLFPVRFQEWQRAGAKNTQHVIGWHAGYCSRQPLADQGQMQMLAMHAHLASEE